MSRVAKALDKLRAEINAAYPDRDKASDGAVGDPAHASRKSDHNPNSAGVVRARDFDKDGIPADRIVKFLISRGKAGDKRCGSGAYVIWNGVIWTANNGWEPRRYTGSNPHDKHFHLSICTDAHHYDSGAAWNLAAHLAPSKPYPTLKYPMGGQGRPSSDVHNMQKILGLYPDGVFTRKVEAVVKMRQKRLGQNPTGIADLAFLKAIGFQPR